MPEQAWTYKKFGFPVPYLVVGRWALTPFPRRTPLRFVVGAPIDPPKVPLGGEVRTKLTETPSACNNPAEFVCSLILSLLHGISQPALPAASCPQASFSCHCGTALHLPSPHAA